MTLTLLLIAGAIALGFALVRLRQYRPATVTSAEQATRLAGQAVSSLARVMVLAADVLRVLLTGARDDRSTEPHQKSGDSFWEDLDS